MNKTICVTGATGFIGGAICYELKKRGFEVFGVDLVKRDHLMPYIDYFVQTDFVNLPNIATDHSFGVVIHCAGTSLVNPSVKSPIEYYDNNVAKTIKLIEWCAKTEKKIIYSSSASVYKTKNAPLMEEDPLDPITPYAKSKKMVEDVLADCARAYNLSSVVFRYFNACGAIPGGIHGQDPGASHIFPKLFECEKDFELNGTDYDTRDGTCIRDYVHITDIAKAHILAIDKHANGIYNLGSEVGNTNLEIINQVGKSYINVGRREGDTDCLIADSTSAKYMLGWVPLSTLSDIVNDLNGWYSSDNFKRLKDAATCNV